MIDRKTILGRLPGLRCGSLIRSSARAQWFDWRHRVKTHGDEDPGNLTVVGENVSHLQQRQLSEKLLCRFSERRFVDWDRRAKGRNTLSFSVTSFSHSERAAIGERELFRVKNVDLKLCV